MSDEFRESQMKAFFDIIDSGLGDDVRFDMNAQDINDWTWLQEFIPGIIISSAGGIVPFQAEGLLHGLPFYYRDRHGQATLNVGSTDDRTPYGLRETLYHAAVDTEEFAGSEVFLKNLFYLVPRLKRSPFLWTFMGLKTETERDESKELSFTVTNEMEEYKTFGVTPEEAWNSLAAPSQYLEMHGFTEEFQRRMWEAQRVSKLPLFQDDRQFPDPEPLFTVTSVPKALRMDDDDELSK